MNPRVSQAITYTRYGGPEVLELVDIPTPQPGPGEISVRVEAAGVNPVDWKLRSGAYADPANTNTPMTRQRVGFDAAGIVTAVGADVDGFQIGDAVVCLDVNGAYATDIVATTATSWVRPSQVSATHGAALGIPAGTAYQAARSLGIGPNDTVLIHGGSGAVGQALIQYAVAWGAIVIATSSPRRFPRIIELGAIPIAYGTNLTQRVEDLATTPITVAVDAVGTDEALQTSLHLVHDHTRVATLVRGRDAASLGIRAFSSGSPHPLTPQQLTWRKEAIPVTLALLATNTFTVELGPTYPLSAAAQAHQASENGEPGKTVLVP